jgi:hypothetical protein
MAMYRFDRSDGNSANNKAMQQNNQEQHCT